MDASEFHEHNSKTKFWIWTLNAIFCVSDYFGARYVSNNNHFSFINIKHIWLIMIVATGKKSVVSIKLSMCFVIDYFIILTFSVQIFLSFFFVVKKRFWKITPTKWCFVESKIKHSYFNKTIFKSRNTLKKQLCKINVMYFLYRPESVSSNCILFPNVYYNRYL